MTRHPVKAYGGKEGVDRKALSLVHRRGEEGGIILFKDFKTPPLFGGHYYARLERRRRGKRG